MRVMTYNIRLGIQQGVEAIADVIAHAGPDVVALQEVGDRWQMGPAGDTTAEIADKAGFAHHHFACAIHQDGGRYGHALLSRWPIEAREIFHFSQEIDEPRVALVAHVDATPAPICVVSTHLSHRAEERAMHGPELVELVDPLLSAEQPTLVLGDLNEDGGADWLEALTARLDDAGASGAQATYPNPLPDERIDYVLVHNARATYAEVLDVKEASDHRPLVVDLEF
jgi:endonuclease/exonuclease/phosphatase family metal-dependent hydrolase